LEEAGLAFALRWYIDRLAQHRAMKVHFEVAPNFGRHSTDVELALYRVAQEGLSNVLRHSGSTVVRVSLECDSDNIVLTVADQGHGIPPEVLEKLRRYGSDLGIGIAGMQERLRQLTGRLEIDSTGQGTTLKAFLPLKRSAG
jgi:two-component system, NarL family, sensor kinase